MSRPTLAEYITTWGLCENSKTALSLIMAGKVLVNEKPGFAGQKLRKSDVVRLKDTPLPFVGKGALKLDAALKAFQIDVKGLVCLDAGASTGGFTDCLLSHQAKLVYAVDVGYGQLDSRLRQDERVVNLEKTNLADPRLLSLSPKPCFGTCDVSYLSLKKAIPYYMKILKEDGQVVALVKPLFEVDDSQARRSGIISDSAYVPLLKDLVRYLNKAPGSAVANVCSSPVTGNNGTLEFFLHIVFAKFFPAPHLDLKIEESVAQALRLLPFRKADRSLYERRLRKDLG